MASFDTFTETEILSRVLGGEKALYEIIVRRFNRYLYKVGRSYDYNHEDTQDLMQETFIDAYKNLSQFERRSNFKTWIIRIMLNNCYRKREKASYKNEIMQDVDDNARPMFIHSNNDTDKIVQNLQNRDAKIHRVLLGMDPIDPSIWKSGVGGHDPNLSTKMLISGGVSLSETKNYLDQLEKQVYVLSKSYDDIEKEAKTHESMLASFLLLNQSD